MLTSVVQVVATATQLNAAYLVERLQLGEAAHLGLVGVPGGPLGGAVVGVLLPGSLGGLPGYLLAAPSSCSLRYFAGKYLMLNHSAKDAHLRQQFL